MGNTEGCTRLSVTVINWNNFIKYCAMYDTAFTSLTTMATNIKHFVSRCPWEVPVLGEGINTKRQFFLLWAHQYGAELMPHSRLFSWCEDFQRKFQVWMHLLLYVNCSPYLAFPVVWKGQVVVGASVLLIVVDVGVEVREVAVQVHAICIVSANQIPRSVWALVGKWREGKWRFQTESYIWRTPTSKQNKKKLYWDKTYVP